MGPWQKARFSRAAARGLYCPAWFHRRLPVLTCYPAARHKPASTDLQAQILTDDPRLDLGATAESQQNP
jgi:hypothetical protein